ncbi:hypothetical protein SLA2020_346920 [Shorea laevis]
MVQRRIIQPSNVGVQTQRALSRHGTCPCCRIFSSFSSSLQQHFRMDLGETEISAALTKGWKVTKPSLPSIAKPFSLQKYPFKSSGMLYSSSSQTLSAHNAIENSAGLKQAKTLSTSWAKFPF